MLNPKQGTGRLHPLGLTCPGLGGDGGFAIDTNNLFAPSGGGGGGGALGNSTSTYYGG